MSLVRSILRRMRYGNQTESEIYLNQLRSLGMRIGENTVVFAPNSVSIDETRPWLIDIGDNVQITRGVTILTHGYDWSVLKGVYGEILGSSGAVHIGNNVFLGMNTTVLKGTRIGNNVIIGACSLVNRDIPDNCVAAGNPCRVIMSLDEYRKKRQKAQMDEARELVTLYRQRYGKEPDEAALSEFFWLFTADPSQLPPSWDSQMRLVGNYEFSREQLEQHTPPYHSLEEFLRSIPPL